jgi:hypothetical protein
MYAIVYNHLLLLGDAAELKRLKSLFYALATEPTVEEHERSLHKQRQKRNPKDAFPHLPPKSKEKFGVQVGQLC